MTFTTHTTASKHIVFATVNGAANDDASGVLEYYNNGSWQQRDEMRGASGSQVVEVTSVDHLVTGQYQELAQLKINKLANGLRYTNLISHLQTQDIEEVFL